MRQHNRKGNQMAKSRSASELALIERAQAHKAEFGYPDWGKDEHNCFLGMELRRELGLDGAKAKIAFDLISMLGLGGNLSQFAQACGFREKKDEAKQSKALQALFKD